MPRVGQLSNGVAGDAVLVNNLRISDNNIDVTLSTAQGIWTWPTPSAKSATIKSETLQNRKVSDTLYVITFETQPDSG